MSYSHKSSSSQKLLQKPRTTYRDNVNKKCDETVKRIEIQDKKVNEVKAELSKSILESSTKNDSLLKQPDNKILTEEKNRGDDVKKLVSDINLIKDTNQKRDTKFEELFKKCDDSIHQRTQIFAMMGELRKKTRVMEENLLLDVGNLQGSVDKLDSEVSKQDEMIKGQQVKLEELQVNLDILSKSLTETATDFENKLQREIKNRSERVSRMEVDILLIKSSNKTKDSKLTELKKENDENQKTLQKSLKDLNLKVTELGKEVIDMKKKQNTMDQLITLFTEKQKKSIENVEVRFNILEFRIQVQEKKSDQEKIEDSNRLSEFTTQFNSKLQQLDNKMQTETKNVHDQFKYVRNNVLLMKDANQTRDSKLTELDQDQKTLQSSVNDLLSQVKDVRKEAVCIKQKQANILDRFSFISEKQSKSISSINITCDKLENKIKEHDKKFDDTNTAVAKQISETSVKFDAQLKQFDKRVTTETLCMRDKIKNLSYDILSLKDSMLIKDSKLEELTKKNDDLLGQIQSLIVESDELDKTIRDLDSRCLQDKKALQDAEFEIKTQIDNLGNFNIDTKQKLTTMEEQITLLSPKVDQLQQDGVNFQQFRDSANRWLWNIKVTCDTLEDKMTAQGKNVEELKTKHQVLSKSMLDSAAVMTSHRKKLEEVIRKETQSRCTEINNLRLEVQAIEKEHQKGNSKIVDLYLKINAQDSKLKSLRVDIDSLNSARKNLEQCSKQAQSTLQELRSQLILEVQQTKTVIEQYKQEIDKTQAIVKTQISAILDKQALIQNKVDKNEEKFKQALSDMDNYLSVKEKELNDAKTNLQTLYTDLFNLRKHVGEKLILHNTKIDELGTAMDTVFRRLGL
ncbi:interaptin-like [Physella acuta]|uniref:interaptin-like n=1 Tax=Physella acuta TaxID=109671 RepID=UPI0027DD2884|nr:interaptin-like [Physella acuta]